MDGIITFPEGLPGFEEARRFVLVSSTALSPFALVQGIDQGAPTFVAIDPRAIEPRYATDVPAAELVRLQAAESDTLLWLALVAANGSDGSATVNLRAPLVVNPKSMLGLQLIAPESAYRTDHPLSAE
jgi:flagellar assembly factor FliW